jgi:hypothetical protein
MPARLDIISQLMKIKYSSKYAKFWNSAREQIKTTNGQRNRIVHWIAISQRLILLEVLGDPRTFLKHPTFWYAGENEQEVTLDDIIAFSEKCDCYSRVLQVFSYLIEPARQHGDKLDPDTIAAWKKVFQAKLEYPLPPNSQLPPDPVLPQRPPNQDRPVAE